MYPSMQPAANTHSVVLIGFEVRRYMYRDDNVRRLMQTFCVQLLILYF